MGHYWELLGLKQGLVIGKAFYFAMNAFYSGLPGIWRYFGSLYSKKLRALARMDWHSGETSLLVCTCYGPKTGKTFLLCNSSGGWALCPQAMKAFTCKRGIAGMSVVEPDLSESWVEGQCTNGWILGMHGPRNQTQTVETQNMNLYPHFWTKILLLVNGMVFSLKSLLQFHLLVRLPWPPFIKYHLPCPNRPTLSPISHAWPT